VVVALSAPVDALPLVAFVPLQPPDAVHADAFAVLHVSVEAPAAGTLVGLAARVTVGSGGGADDETVTATVADAGVVPASPVHVSV
jgi:hypothetical protein